MEYTIRRVGKNFRKRSRLELYYVVLRVMERGERRITRLLYEANTSWGPMVEILKSLIAQGLVEKVRISEYSWVEYHLTEKGREVLRDLERTFKDHAWMIEGP